MKKKYWLLIIVFLILAGGAYFIYQKYYKKTASVPPSSCGVSNCHGLDISCGKPAQMCTEMFSSGDICRQYAECEIKNGACQQKINDNFSKCKLCVENCQKNNSNDPEKELNCESNCSIQESQFILPVANYKTGQTKKVFGQYITPENSPVQPEKFTGYHTGVDIEEEQNDVNVPVYAISDGTIKFVGEVGGYGGVLIYETTIESAPVTILYGHIRLSSATKNAGETVSKGEELAVLGSPYSSETDGERKHLHFAIHKGAQVDYHGYVQNQSELSSWINPGDIIK